MRTKNAKDNMGDKRHSNETTKELGSEWHRRSKLDDVTNSLCDTKFYNKNIKQVLNNGFHKHIEKLLLLLFTP